MLHLKYENNVVDSSKYINNIMIHYNAIQKSIYYLFNIFNIL